MRVIASKGAGGVSVSDIAEASGLSRGAFYNYFPHPDDLLNAVAEQIGGDLRNVALEAISATEDPPEQLARVALSYFEKALEDPVWGWLWLQLDFSRQAPALAGTRLFEQLLRRGIELGRFRTEAPAQAVAAIAFGSMRMAARIALTSSEPDAELARATIRIALIGLGMTGVEADEVLRRAANAGLAPKG